MPLLNRLQNRPHSIQAFQAAAFARFQEGRFLGIHGKRLASIYLLGYVAEMLLKAAYFRLKGFPPSQTISIADLQNARSYALSLGCTWPGNLHSLRGWQALLIEERKQQGRPFAPAFLRAFNARIHLLARNWKENLRYYDCRPYRGELSSCFQTVAWLRGQYRFL